MTDKEIIIDGVNVAGCAHLVIVEGEELPPFCGLDTFTCAGETCYYKQLKRLEQENKNLREAMHKDFCSHYVLGECSEEHHNNCVGRNQCIKDLEQENAELKKERDIVLGQLVINDGEDVTVQISQSQFDEYNKLEQENAELKALVSQRDVSVTAQTGIILELKAENERLIEELSKFYRNKYYIKMLKYRQTLQKIKEIAETGQDKYHNGLILAEQIIQLIESEVE